MKISTETLGLDDTSAARRLEVADQTPPPPQVLRARWKHSSALAAKLLVVAGVLATWQIVSTVLVGEETVPSPAQVLEALVSLWSSGDFWTALGQTLRAWSLGLLICIVVGVPVGLFLGSYTAASRSARWVIDFFRTIPTIALLPLVLLLFGTSVKMEITMIVASAIWPLIIQSMYAAGQVEPLQQWVFRVFRVSTLDRLRFLLAPSVSLMVMTGLRLAATMALLMTISAEYIGGAPGLGSALSEAEVALDRPAVFAYAFTAGLLGLSINLLLVRAQRRVLWWHPSVREGRS